MKHLYLLAGMTLTFISIFAKPLGIDQNDQWGFSRLLFLILGIFFLGSSLFRYFNLAQYIHPRYRTFFQRFRSDFSYIFFTKKSAIILSLISILIIIIFSIWFTTAGMMNHFPKVTNYYKDLSDAFSRGQVSMLVTPDPRLAELADPYDQQSRLEIPVVHDWSYYQGKYYLYWGPVPAGLFLVLRSLGILDPAGQIGILFFYMGIVIILAFLFYSLWKDYFPKAWGGYIGLILLISCVSLPFSFLLGRPQIYENSIIAGQFFLITGIFFWYQAMKSSKHLLFALAGLSWGLAIGSRYNLALSVGIVLVFTVYLFIRKWRQFHHYFRYGLSLFFPLLLVCISLGIYNYQRFGNVFETGISYQFTLSVYNKQYYSFDYLKSSIFYYLSFPLTRINSFPIFEFPRVTNSIFPGWALPSQGKAFDESGTGILRSFQLLNIAIFMIPMGIRELFLYIRKNTTSPTIIGDEQKALMQGHLFSLFSLMVLFQFFFLSFYFYGAMRFTMDFFLPLIVLVFLTILKTDSLLSRFPFFRTLFGIIVIFLGINTILIGVFGGINVPPQVFRHSNPEGYQKLKSLINPHYLSFREIANSNGIIGLLLRGILKTFF